MWFNKNGDVVGFVRFFYIIRPNLQISLWNLISGLLLSSYSGKY